MKDTFFIYSLIAITIVILIAIPFLVRFVRDLIDHVRIIGELKEKNKMQESIIKNLQAEIKARDEFLSITSHELKTPLTSMLLQLQTALHNIRTVSLANFSVENLLKMLENAERQTTRLSKMINDFLNISLITSKKLELEREEIDLSEVTNGVVENFSEKLKHDGIRLDLNAPTPVTGRWDRVRIEQAITNLISNAIKYGDKKPITVEVAGDNGGANIIVKDQGIGISPQEKHKIFELFERAVPTNKYKGLGVGLFITNEIVKAHGGKITVNKNDGHGTVFTIELPV